MKTANKKRDVADKIFKHLIEDPKLYCPQVCENGRWGISISYKEYQYSVDISLEEAEEYLKWLDAGNVGTHWEMRQEKPK